MKKINFCALLAFIWLGLLCSCQNDDIPAKDLWRKLNTPYFGEPLDIKFINADTGYILGVEVNHINDSVYNILIKTVDGGQTWQQISYKDHKFLTDISGGVMQNIYVSPFNSKIIFSGSSNLLRSIDGGIQWKKVDTVNRLGTPNMIFLDPANGLCSTGNTICRTTDSGMNWISYFNYSSTIGFHLLPFTSKNTGYFAGGIEFDGSAGGVMGKTTDGGNTWQVISYPFDAIVSASFINDNIGYVSMITASGSIATEYLGSKLIKTIDGGSTWQVIHQNPNDNKGTGYFNLHFTTEQEGFCTNVAIFHTLDGGNTWKKESTVPASLLSFPNAETGFAVDINGNVYKRLK